MGSLSRIFVKLHASPRRAAMLEICLLTPAALLLIAGLISLTGYFYLARRVQDVAEQAAQAAAAGPAAARLEIARVRVQQELERRGMAQGASFVSLSDEGGRLRLQLSYDASRSPVFVLDGLMPMPSSTIVRSAAFRPGV